MINNQMDELIEIESDVIHLFDLLSYNDYNQFDKLLKVRE